MIMKAQNKEKLPWKFIIIYKNIYIKDTDILVNKCAI